MYKKVSDVKTGHFLLQSDSVLRVTSQPTFKTVVVQSVAVDKSKFLVFTDKNGIPVQPINRETSSILCCTLVRVRMCGEVTVRNIGEGWSLSELQVNQVST